MVDKIWYNMEELIGGSEERVLIETYWNVKLYSYFFCSSRILVLIETYWNVKIVHFTCLIICHGVLIETYWNVKMTPTQTSRNEKEY